MIRSPALRLLLLLCCLSAPALGAGEREKARLESLRDQRGALEKQLKESETAHAEVADRLRDTEKGISAVGRKLHALGEERTAVQAELSRHERDLKQIERQTVHRQAQLGHLLRYRFRAGEADSLTVLLAGGDPNGAARDRYFLALLSRAKLELIADLRRDAATARGLAEHIQSRSEQIAELARREETERQTLRQRQQERQAAMSKIASRIQLQRREIDALRQDEQRLSQLISTLGKRSAKAKTGSASPAPPPEKTAPAGTAAAREPSGPGSGDAAARLRGHLLRPVAGSVAARFGARREGGQALWKGMFIAATEGAPVRATAAGVVVFSDWLRGYGNLLIIDHDHDLLSVYGNNQALLADVGRKVGAGETVATAGAGGGGVDSGLYFELRHRGQAFDPAKWLVP